MGGIADVLLAHHVGDPRRLGFEMEALDTHRGKLRQIEPRQDVQHHQHGDARTVRRALPDIVALIRGADRHRGLGAMGGEILQRMQAADAAQGLHHVRGDSPRVERIAAALGDRPQGLAKLGLVDHIARHRRLAMRQQIALGVGALLQLLELQVPVEGIARGHHIALFRGLDRGLQQGIEPEPAVILQDGFPGIDRAGNADGVCRRQLDRTQIVFEIPFGCRRHRRAARAIIGNDPALAFRLHQREAVAADAGGLRLDHAEQRACRNRRVCGRAACPHHLDRRQRRQRMRRRHHRILRMDRRSAGEMEIPHAQLLTLSLFSNCPAGGNYMAYSRGHGQCMGMAVVPAKARGPITTSVSILTTWIDDPPRQ